LAVSLNFGQKNPWQPNLLAVSLIIGSATDASSAGAAFDPTKRDSFRVYYININILLLFVQGTPVGPSITTFEQHVIGKNTSRSPYSL